MFLFGISKLYRDQCAEVRLDQETGEVWRWEEKLDKDAVCRHFY